MKNVTQNHQFKQRFFQVLRCLTCKCILIEGEEKRCRLCAGYFAIYGKQKKEDAA